jgi:hypothetical protein
MAAASLSWSPCGYGLGGGYVMYSIVSVIVGEYSSLSEWTFLRVTEYRGAEDSSTESGMHNQHVTGAQSTSSSPIDY